MLRLGAARLPVSSALTLRGFAAAGKTIKAGDSLPAVKLQENEPGKLVDPVKEFASGKHLIFGVPGAFTPGCSKTHLPGYLKDADKWKKAGVKSLNCISVNDAFCMGEWGKANKADGKVRMLADPRAEFVKAAGLDVDATAVLGNVRSKRFAMVVENGKVKHIEVEPDNFGLSCSLSENVFKKL
eukprot:g41337.t1